MKDRRVKKIISALLAAVMALSMAACGTKKDTDAVNTDSEKEYVWVPEFVELGDENGRYYDAIVRGDYIYSENYEWDEETEQSRITIKSISLSDHSEGPSIPLVIEQPEDGQGGRNLNRFDLDEEGNLYTIETIYRWNENTGESSQQYFLCRYDKEGVKLSEVDFTKDMGDNENNYIDTIAVDGEKRVYASGNNVIYLFDSEGAFKGSISLGNKTYIRGMGMDRNGVMCVAMDDYSSGDNGTQLKEIDFDKKAFGASYDNYPNGNSNGHLSAGLEKDFLVNGGSVLYEYDKEKQATEELFNWLDCDINGNNVEFVHAMEDGRIMVLTNDWETRASEVALLTKKKASEVARKETITIGALYENSSLQSAAVKFNKTNDKYRISIKSYYDYNDVTSDNYQQVMSDAINRLNNDITSANCPDILELSQLNMAQLAAKGVFEDLNPFLERSDVLSRGDYMESILDSYSYNGLLVAIPRSIELMTVAGKTSEVGEKPGWTLEEMLSFADRYPDAVLFDYSAKADIISFLVSYNQGAFVDWESGKCSFDTDSFKNLLTFANKFPDKYDRDSDDDRSTPTKIADGDVLLDREYLYDFNNIQLAEGIFGEPVTFIGYPNDEGNGGCYIQASGLLAITSKSKNKEGAWEFLEGYLMEEKGWYDFGFPTRKAALQAAVEEAIKVEYVLDENGEPMLDEDGNPLTYENVSIGSVGYGDGWSYEYHKTTQEEVDRLMELLEIARPVTDSDSQIMNIITEEAEAFFKGQKSVDDVAGVIQSRVQVYVNENR